MKRHRGVFYLEESSPRMIFSWRTDRPDSFSHCARAFSAMKNITIFFSFSSCGRSSQGSSHSPKTEKRGWGCGWGGGKWGEEGGIAGQPMPRMRMCSGVTQRASAWRGDLIVRTVLWGSRDLLCGTNCRDGTVLFYVLTGNGIFGILSRMHACRTLRVRSEIFHYFFSVSSSSDFYYCNHILCSTFYIF